MDIWSDQLSKNKFGYDSLNPWWPGMVDLLPEDTPLYKPLTLILKDATLIDSTKEPAYSIVYGRGIPVCDWKLSLGIMGAKSINELIQLRSAEDAAQRGFDSFGKYDNPLSYGLSLNYGT
jgi:hypothetical protein